jgi:hypothetical protein
MKQFADFALTCVKGANLMNQNDWPCIQINCEKYLFRFFGAIIGERF